MEQTLPPSNAPLAVRIFRNLTREQRARLRDTSYNPATGTLTDSDIYKFMQLESRAQPDYKIYSKYLEHKTKKQQRQRNCYTLRNKTKQELIECLLLKYPIFYRLMQKCKYNQEQMKKDLQSTDPRIRRKADFKWGPLDFGINYRIVLRMLFNFMPDGEVGPWNMPLNPEAVRRVVLYTYIGEAWPNNIASIGNIPERNPERGPTNTGEFLNITRAQLKTFINIIFPYLHLIYANYWEYIVDILDAREEPHIISQYLVIQLIELLAQNLYVNIYNPQQRALIFPTTTNAIDVRVTMVERITAYLYKKSVQAYEALTPQQLRGFISSIQNNTQYVSTYTSGREYKLLNIPGNISSEDRRISRILKANAERKANAWIDMWVIGSYIQPSTRNPYTFLNLGNGFPANREPLRHIFGMPLSASDINRYMDIPNKYKVYTYDEIIRTLYVFTREQLIYMVNASREEVPLDADDE